MAADIPNLKHASLPFIVKMVVHRHNENVETRAWQQYLVDYGHMTKSTYKPYESPLKRQTKISKKTAGELLAEADSIRKEIRKG